jgi:thioredoxin reductase (NADPH)
MTIGIIGAGPCGLFSIFQCGMFGLKTEVFDILPHVGGQCGALYPEKFIYDIPAIPKIKAKDLIENLMIQSCHFLPTFHFSQQVTSINKDGDDFIIKTSKNTTSKVKAIIIAAGAGAFGPQRPPLPNIEKFEQKSIFYSIYDPHSFSKKHVVIAGGGDSAIDWALHLAPIAKTVQLVHRRDKFRAHQSSINELKAMEKCGKIKLVIPYQLHGIQGDESNGRLYAVDVQHTNGSIQSLEADVLLPFFGLSMNLGPILEWGLNIDKNHIPIHPTTCETSIPGIFAIGDIALYPHKQKLILSGFSEAASAAKAIWHYLNPGQSQHFEHSTTKFTNCS